MLLYSSEVKNLHDNLDFCLDFPNRDTPIAKFYISKSHNDLSWWSTNPQHVAILLMFGEGRGYYTSYKWGTAAFYSTVIVIMKSEFPDTAFSPFRQSCFIHWKFFPEAKNCRFHSESQNCSCLCFESIYWQVLTWKCLVVNALKLGKNRLIYLIVNKL